MGFYQLLYPPGSDAQQVAGGNYRDQCGLGDAGRLRDGNDDDVRVVRRGRPVPLVRRDAAAPRTCWARFNRMSRSGSKAKPPRERLSIRAPGQVTVDQDARTARVGGGTTLPQLDATHRAHTLATTGGRVGTSHPARVARRRLPHHRRRQGHRFADVAQPGPAPGTSSGTVYAWSRPHRVPAGPADSRVASSEPCSPGRRLAHVHQNHTPCPVTERPAETSNTQ